MGKKIQRKGSQKVGLAFRAWRKENKITYRRMANALQYRFISTVQKIESGEIDITVIALLEACDILGLSAQDFLVKLSEK